MTKRSACLAFFLLAGLSLARAQTVNCLVAFVNGQALTLMDLEIAREFGLFEQEAAAGSGDERLAILDALIDQKVVLEVARESVTVRADELSLALGALRGKLGAEAFQAKLQRFGLAEDDLRPYLADRIRFNRVVSTRFSAAVTVSRGEVEKFYREVYSPEQKAKGLEPDAIETVISGLEARIREDLKARKVAEWVRNARSQAEIRINKDCLK
jgi:parvulin-like peptidyl-prolyl isomerase